MDPKSQQTNVFQPNIPPPPTELTQDPHGISSNSVVVVPPPVPSVTPAPVSVSPPQSVMVEPTSPPPPVDIPVTNDSSNQSSKPSKLLLALLVVFAIVLAGLVYALLSGSLLKTSTQEESLSPIPVSTDLTPPEPSPTLTDEEELNTVDVSSIEAELDDVKTDLEGL